MPRTLNLPEKIRCVNFRRNSNWNHFGINACQLPQFEKEPKNDPNQGTKKTRYDGHFLGASRKEPKARNSN